MVSRVLDVAVLMLVAVAVLLPRPDVRVQPALRLDPEQRERVAELEAQLLASPGDGALSLELADLFLDAHRPEWALSTLGRAIDRTPHDHRLFLRRSLALADHFEAGPAYQAAVKALTLCEGGSTAKCSETERSRIEFLRATLEKVKDLDMRQDPNTAKERLLRALKPAYIPKRKAPPAAPPAAP